MRPARPAGRSGTGAGRLRLHRKNHLGVGQDVGKHGKFRIKTTYHIKDSGHRSSALTFETTSPGHGTGQAHEGPATAADRGKHRHSSVDPGHGALPLRPRKPLKKGLLHALRAGRTHLFRRYADGYHHHGEHLCFGVKKASRLRESHFDPLAGKNRDCTFRAKRPATAFFSKTSSFPGFSAPRLVFVVLARLTNTV